MSENIASNIAAAKSALQKLEDAMFAQDKEEGQERTTYIFPADALWDIHGTIRDALSGIQEAQHELRNIII